MKYSFNLPGNVSIKGRHLWVELLVSPNESIFVYLPDLPIVVPRWQIILEVSGICLHSSTDQSLYFVDLLISGHNIMDRLQNTGRNTCYRLFLF